MKRIILLLSPLFLMLCSFVHNAENNKIENYYLQITAKTSFFDSVQTSLIGFSKRKFNFSVQ